MCKYRSKGLNIFFGGKAGKGIGNRHRFIFSLGEEEWYYDIIFCQLGLFCDFFGLALGNSPHVCFDRPSCHGGHEET